MVRVGVLAMFDALGFKGIWNRPESKDNPTLVINKLLDLESEAQKTLDREFGGRTRAERDPGSALGQCGLAFLSDTVVLGIATKSQKELESLGRGAESFGSWSLVVAARFASMIMREAAKTAPTLAYRGCIAYGEFAFENNFIVGRAVDVAAESMDRAQGAFVWLTPEALDFLHGFDSSPESLHRHGLVPYRVPLKGGDVYDTHVVSPFDINGTAAERSAITTNILATFKGSVDVAVKKQNTAQFLKFASDVIGTP